MLDEQGTPPVLRCTLCTKTFEKPSTLHRHGYYCRSRQFGAKTRVRSCHACAQNKTKCDNRRPRCSRCILKGVECRYPERTTKAERPKPGNGRALPSPASTTGTPSMLSDLDQTQALPDKATEILSISGSGIALDLPDVIPIADIDFDDPSIDPGQWNDTILDFGDLMGMDSEGDASTSPSSITAASSTEILLPQTQAWNHIVSIPAQPSTNVRSIVQRIPMTKGTQRIASLILHNLKSYPRMMLHQSNPPPFIHQHSVCFGDEDDTLGTLNTCMSLLHMANSGMKDCRKLFWKYVRIECETLRSRYQDLNKWELLAAMQALSIYIIVRLEEGETDSNNCDALLVAATIVIAKRFNTISAGTALESSTTEFDPKAIWKDWIFEESRRRLCIIYRVVNMLVYFEPAAICELQTDLAIAPLPSKKPLWEANNEVTWMHESAPMKIDYGLAANGDLVELDNDALLCGDQLLVRKSPDSGLRSRQVREWEEWCSGMDGLGSLVMLAAALIT
ncbi:hypothetical protein EJ05DRAFT_474937 [Pseudovirgaria hyperparasitica]|uniref:Zn(2)-C6 fungal-type domain-containing protein n=1 Tax=Pseudovirgaria hyperparasitica TaxID=470096 RepID=A0A6A6WCJ3_9PEZI|nr:uncharacterized protein EJ05DRAFT_474937 [Pseudovirgaria hyperparasitica]KAF2759899.1 hypothetical protein EJ05DRAFT_474937 [Pseudovirgaria hyperparasitica]